MAGGGRCERAAGRRSPVQSPCSLSPAPTCPRAAGRAFCFLLGDTVRSFPGIEGCVRSPTQSEADACLLVQTPRGPDRASDREALGWCLLKTVRLRRVTAPLTPGCLSENRGDNTILTGKQRQPEVSQGLRGLWMSYSGQTGSWRAELPQQVPERGHARGGGGVVGSELALEGCGGQ